MVIWWSSHSYTMYYIILNSVILYALYYIMLYYITYYIILYYIHCVKSVQIRSIFWSVFSHIRTEFSPNAGKYGPEKTLYLDTFHAVIILYYIITLYYIILYYIMYYIICIILYVLYYILCYHMFL